MISKSQPSYLDSTDRANILFYSSSMIKTYIFTKCSAVLCTKKTCSMQS